MVQEEGTVLVVAVVVVYPEVDELVNAQTHIRLSTMAPRLSIIKSTERENRLNPMVEKQCLLCSSCSA